MQGEKPDAHVPNDIRPVVGRETRKIPRWVLPGIALIAAALLFQALEARRQAAQIPALGSGPVSSPSMVASPPPLLIPDISNVEGGAGFLPESLDVQEAARLRQPPSSRMQPALPPIQPPAGFDYVAGMSAYPPASPTLPAQAGPPVTVYDASIAKPQSGGAGSGGKSQERVNAEYFQNPGTTIPKGTVIQAVLETALDSTRPGFARAIVSRDVFGFDGKQILVPKGSRLVGEYKADLATGQKRALIQWQRLMRPDGAIINLDSPSADPLGRAGVKGKVDGHFFERFSGAMLQSVLEIGVQLATQSVARDNYIVALPGATQNLSGTAPEKIQPTLKVRQGASVSVFVSRDLDFSAVEQ